jgi:hypothetical protein
MPKPESPGIRIIETSPLDCLFIVMAAHMTSVRFIRGIIVASVPCSPYSLLRGKSASKRHNENNFFMIASLEWFLECI